MRFFSRPDAQLGAGFSAPEGRLSEFSPPDDYPLMSRIGEAAQNATEIRPPQETEFFNRIGRFATDGIGVRASAVLTFGTFACSIVGVG